jgi:UDP-N-acetylglucosamine transferase subunit ALG13
VIFVTVGTQLPFERLVRAVDEWASDNKDKTVFIQLGNTLFRPRNCEFSAFLDSAHWEQLFQESELIVSHAGMGTILKSIEYDKPLILIPRLASLGEHRNDHQVATASKFGNYLNIKVIKEIADLPHALDFPPASGLVPRQERRENLEMLIGEVKKLINDKEL